MPQGSPPAEASAADPIPYRILDTPPEPEFDGLTQLAAQLCGAPTALLGFFAGDRQWFKSSWGWSPDSLPRDRSLCRFTVADGDALVVPDATRDARFQGEPLVVEEPRIRFYAGVPLRTPTGGCLGTLCVLGREPRELGSAQLEALRALARQAEALLEARRTREELALARRQIARQTAELDLIYQAVPLGLCLVNEELRFERVNERLALIDGASAAEHRGRTLGEIVPALVPRLEPVYRRVLDEGKTVLDEEVRGRTPAHPDEEREWRASYYPLRNALGGAEGVLGVVVDVTERRRAEEALGRAQFTLDHLSDSVLWVDANARLVYVNEAACQLLGYRREELLTMHVFDIDPNYPKTDWTEHWRRSRERQRFVIETLHRSRTGRDFPVEVRVTHLEYAGQELHCTIARDVSERKRVEERLRIHEERLRLAVQTARQGLYDLDLGTGRAEFSPEYATMLGYDPNQLRLTVEVWQSWLHPDDRDEALTTLRACAQGVRKEYDLVSRLRAQTGEWRWIRSTGKVVSLDAQGRPARIIGMHTDMTAQREVEEALRRQHDELQSLQANVPGMVYSFVVRADGGWSFPYVNEASREMFGLEPEEIQRDASLLPRLLHPDDVAPLQAAIAESIRQMTTFRLEMRHLVRGELRWHDCRSQPQRLPNGDVLFHGVMMDVTARKRVETELRMFQFALDEAPEGVFWLDPQATFIYVNEQACRSLGYARAELLRLRVFDVDPLFTEDDWRVGLQLFRSREVVTHRVETEHRRKDGTRVPVEVYSKHYWFQDTEVHVAFVRDITERKQTEALTLAQRDLALALSGARRLEDALPLCIQTALRISGLDCGAIYLVEDKSGALRLAHHAGLSPELAQAVAHFGADTPNASWVMAGKAFSRRAADLQLEYAAYPGGGWRGVVILPILHEERPIAALALASRTLETIPELALHALESLSAQVGGTITRIRAEAALRDSEQRLRLALAAANQGSFDLDLVTDGAVTSPEYAAILGYDPEGFRESRERWLARLHPDDRVQAQATFEAYLKGELPKYEVESRQRHPAGEWKWIATSGRIINRDAEGRPLRFIGTITDISERKRAEEALRASLEEKSALLKEVHHRVKNNLQVMVSILNLQAARPHPPEVLSVLRDTQSRVRSMASLHEALYHSESLARVDFATYLDTLGAHLLRAYGVEGDRIRLVKRAAHVRLGLDQAVPCGLIINELVTNALKHAFPNARSGEIRVELRAEPPDRVCLRVADNGVGLPPGLEMDRSKTLGMRLIQALAKQLRGTVTMGEPPGTSFSIGFAVPIDDGEGGPGA